MVDFDQELVGFDEIAFVHVHLGDIAVDAGENIDELVGDQVGRIGSRTSRSCLIGATVPTVMTRVFC